MVRAARGPGRPPPARLVRMGRHPRPHPLHGREPHGRAPAQPLHERGGAGRALAQHVDLGAGRAQERLDLAPEGGPDGPRPHRRQQPVGRGESTAPPLRQRGDEAGIAARPRPERPERARWARTASRSLSSRLAIATNVRRNGDGLRDGGRGRRRTRRLERRLRPREGTLEPARGHDPP